MPGGVVAMVKTELGLSVDEKLSGPDLLVLKANSVCIFSAYILPHGSPWEGFAAISPLDKLAQSLAIAKLRGDAIIVVGDLNGCTGDRRVSKDAHPERFSLDDVVNTQGRLLLQLGEDYGLRILNGDLKFGSASWGWTFAQKRGSKWCRSVIDYVLGDLAGCQMVQALEVGDIGPWSDHAPLILRLRLEDVIQAPNPGLIHIRSKLREAAESKDHLDVLLRDTLDAKKSPEERQADFYGPVYDESRRCIEVYTDGSCMDNGLATAHAGAGVYYGQNSRYNAALRVTGDQTNNRGELLAILYVLSTVPASKSLRIFTDSEYSIRSVVYWAPDHAQKGWKCANADLLQDIVSWIQFRSASVEFIHVKAHSGNYHNDAADAAAKTGAGLPLLAAQYVPCHAPLFPLLGDNVLRTTKVSCNIPREVLAPTQQPARGDDKEIDSYQFAAHRGRALHRAIQQANLNKLTDASSNSAAFWKVYRSMANPKPRSPAVTISDLASCFERRMNAPDPAPQSFNMKRMDIASECAANIPLPSRESSDPSLKGNVTEGDVEWAKEHLKSHYATAVGIDKMMQRLKCWRRRLILALRYLKYLVELKPSHYARLALEDSYKLHCAGMPGYWMDLVYALQALCFPVVLPPLSDLTPERSAYEGYCLTESLAGVEMPYNVKTTESRILKLSDVVLFSLPNSQKDWSRLRGRSVKISGNNRINQRNIASRLEPQVEPRQGQNTTIQHPCLSQSFGVTQRKLRRRIG
ncbi:hypothetical protein R3P38DRAFT_3559416 [Favolaschia claudopus]|uniref:ribonuclease H n=1 Tax=Favolaschia claudopus TaxID=2862362 RepID=A0AAW0AVI0_9AGAR